MRTARVKDTLVKARGLIEDPARWIPPTTVHCAWNTRTGRPVWAHSPRANAWDWVGAIARAVGNWSVARRPPQQALYAAARGQYRRAVGREASHAEVDAMLNGATHAELLAIFDEAIAGAE